MKPSFFLKSELYEISIALVFHSIDDSLFNRLIGFLLVQFRNGYINLDHQIKMKSMHHFL